MLCSTGDLNLFTSPGPGSGREVAVRTDTCAPVLKTIC